MLSLENQSARSPTQGAGNLRTLGKYELIARIGKGGMAEVFLARQRGPMNFEKVVVVKTIHPHLSAQKEFIDMLLDEARIAALLKHPCVVDIYELGEDGETYFIAMEYLSGQPLLSVLRAGRQKKRPLSIHGTCRIIADVADGLHSAHELKDNTGRKLELVHRDITPGNIIVLYDGQVKIVDFGIAKARGRMATETNARQLKGKLGYVAPEQIRNEPVDRRADIFALGVVMWEALTYRRLFRGNDPGAVLSDILKKDAPPPSAHRPEIPAALDAICRRALARDPGKRYAEASELYTDLEKFLASAGASLQKRVIADYMGEVFTSEIAGHEHLLRATAEAKRMIDAAQPRRVRAGTFSDDGSSGSLYRSSGQMVAVGADGGDAASRRSSGALERVSDPSLAGILPPGGAGGLDRASASEIHRASDPSLGRVTLPTMGVALPAPDPRTRRRRLIAGLSAAGALALLLVIGLTSEDGNEPSPAAIDSAGVIVAQGNGTNPDDIAMHAGEDAAPGGAESGTETGMVPAEVAPDEPVPELPEPDLEAAAQADSAARNAARALYKEGITLFIQGKLLDAQHKLEAALQSWPGHAQAYRGLGMVYEGRGYKQVAAKAFRIYLQMAPSARDRDVIEKRLSALEE